jgi:hypothetical protein
MASSIKIPEAMSVIKNLNAVFSENTATPIKILPTTGTYALINQMISDLSSIKSTIKKAEKQIEIALDYQLTSSTSSATFNNSDAQTTLSNTPINTANRKVATRPVGVYFSGAAETVYGLRNATNDATDIGIKFDGVPFFTEPSIFQTLAEAWFIIKSLKSGHNTGLSTATTADI